MILKCSVSCTSYVLLSTSKSDLCFGAINNSIHNNNNREGLSKCLPGIRLTYSSPLLNLICVLVLLIIASTTTTIGRGCQNVYLVLVGDNILDCQHYNTEEKPTVILYYTLYTFIIVMQVLYTPKQKQKSSLNKTKTQLWFDIGSKYR